MSAVLQDLTSSDRAKAWRTSPASCDLQRRHARIGSAGMVAETFAKQATSQSDSSASTHKANRRSPFIFANVCLPDVSKSDAPQTQIRSVRFFLVQQICTAPDRTLWLGVPYRVGLAHDEKSDVLSTQLQAIDVSPDGFGDTYFLVPRSAMTIAGGSPELEHSTLPLRALIERDPLIRRLAMCIAPFLHEPGSANPTFVELISSALNTHICSAIGMTPDQRPRHRGGLAAWQERRVKQLLLGRIDDDVSLAELAAECRLSVSHFTRAFRQSNGVPPHRWLIEQRVEKSKQLLLELTRSLSDIALHCGFADQSHFTRVFSRLVGVAPGTWRRLSAG